MFKTLCATSLMAIGLAAPGVAQPAPPDLTGSWTCEAAPLVMRGDWTTLTYTIDIHDQRDGLFIADMVWNLPPSVDVKGNQQGQSSFSGKVTTFGVIDWDNRTVETVAYKDLHRHRGTIVDNDTIRFIHSEVGDNAWVSRSICRRSQ